jgi:hypothetical protein
MKGIERIIVVGIIGALIGANIRWIEVTNQRIHGLEVINSRIVNILEKMMVSPEEED